MIQILTKEEEAKLSIEELREYYSKLRLYYQNLSQDNTEDKLHKAVNPLIKALARHLNGTEIKIVHNGLEEVGYEGSIIYACNHTNSHDMPLMIEVAKRQYYVFSSNELENDINGLLFKINGVVFVDRMSKESRSEAKEKLLHHCCSNRDILIFPEATWNVTPSTPMLPLHWGVIELAQTSGNPIVPVATEYKEDTWYVSIGEPIFIEPNKDKKEAIDELRDTMATLKWNLWEMFPPVKREDIEENYHEKYLERIYGEYPKLDPEFEKQTILKNGDTEEEVFSFMDNLDLNRNNAFLLSRKRTFRNNNKK